jgi:hypothetical protein
MTTQCVTTQIEGSPYGLNRELIVPVFPTTSMVAIGLPNTGKYEKSEWNVGDCRG